MFYKRKFYLILSLFLVIVLSIAYAMAAYFNYIKSVNAAEQTTDGVYTLSDLSTNLDNTTFVADDKYTVVNSNNIKKVDEILNANTKIGVLPLANNSITLEFELNYLKKGGTLSIGFTKKNNNNNNIIFQITLTSPQKIKIGSLDSSGKYTSQSENISDFLSSYCNGSFMCICSMSTNSSITIKSGENSISFTENKSLGNIEKCDVFLYHNTSFVDVTIKDAYCKVSTAIVNADGGTVTGVTLKITKGDLLKSEDLAVPNSYMLNGELYEFDYWSVDGERYDFNKPVHSTFTLVAQYKKASQIKGSITVVDSDGNILQSFYENEIYGIDSKFDKSKVETTIDKLKGFTYDGSLYCKLSDIPFENNDIQVTAEVITVYIEDGASVRLAEPAGIRFSGGNSIDCVEYGMFLTAKDYLSDNENNMTVDYLKENNLTYSTITSLNGIKQSVNDRIAKYAIVLKDIKTENYGVDFVARSFVKVKYYDNTECYIYSDFSFDDNSRSIYNVANKAISDFGGSNEVLQKYIDGVIELKEIDGEIIFVANNYKNYKVEIQKEENSVLITVIPNDGIESLVIGSIIFNGKLKKIDVSSSNQYRISYR